MGNAQPPDGHIIHEQALLACEGCLWPQAAYRIRIANPPQLKANPMQLIRQLQQGDG